MSWTNELYKVYELAVDPEFAKKGGRPMLLPVAHSIAKANIEICITEDGELVDGGINTVDNSDEETIVPDTGKAKTGLYPAPYPLNESLRYIAGDLNLFIPTDLKDNTKSHSDYIELLTDWKNSPYSHPALNAVYNYLIKNTVTDDCIKSGVLVFDNKIGKLKKNQFNTTVDKSFVRFAVMYSDPEREKCTWRDNTLFNSFIKYLSSKSTDKQLCYATGEETKIADIHPTGIVKTKVKNSDDSAVNAKLISANDNKNFTFRGRFSDKNEAFLVGYDYSQKAHNALKWLIKMQGEVYGSLTLIAWNNALRFVPNITHSIFPQFDNELEEYSSITEKSKMLRKAMLGGKNNFEPTDKVMIMGLEATNKGRLSISVYSELTSSDFYNNILKWHSETMWPRNHTGKNSSSILQLADCLFGDEQSGSLICDPKIKSDTIFRLIPCVTEGRRLPKDIVRTLYNRASAPLSFDKKYDHTAIIENACAMIRKESIDYRKGEIKMAFDPKCTDRSYLFGCLLAIADKTEEDSYEENEKKRVTNARRLWNAFSSRPYQTWQIIEERLQPYLAKEKWIMVNFTKHINEIMGKMTPGDFEDNSKLSPMYLIGYHHYNALLRKKNNDNNEEE